MAKIIHKPKPHRPQPPLRQEPSPVAIANFALHKFNTLQEQVEHIMLTAPEVAIPYARHFVERWWVTYKVNCLRAVAELLVLNNDEERKKRLASFPKSMHEDVRAIYKVERKHWQKQGGACGMSERHVLVEMLIRRNMGAKIP